MRMNSFSRTTLILFWLAIILLPVPSFSFVSPDQVAVLVNENDPNSRALGTYYMKRRGIPPTNQVELDLPVRETISRDVYEEALVKPVQKVLTQKNLDHRIRVLVTVFGIPLRVQAPKPTLDERQWMDDAQEWVTSVMNLLREEEQKLWDHVPLVVGSPVREEPILPPASTQQFEASQINRWRNEFVDLVKNLEPAPRQKSDVKEKNGEASSVSKKIRRIFGWLGMKEEVGMARVPSLTHQRRMAVAQRLALLLHQPSSHNRAQAYQLVQESFGYLGVLALANWERSRYRLEEASASVDSELSLLWWELGSYPLTQRFPNPLYWETIETVQNSAPPVLMVSRLDAPTPTHVRNMIDQAIETESRGLVGKVYVDARGMKKGPPFSSGFYDADLQNFATRFRDHSAYTVQLENTEQRFSQPEQAPDVALYVGWYRLRHYEDAFTFNPGAIGYHIASGEAVSIHNPNESGWCKNALERGITVTLGPVGEPYLDAFPLPTEFYGLLFSGRYSLVEAYFLSKRYVSWKMVLFGDPLYRPWTEGAAPRQKVAQRIWGHGPLPNPPGQKSFRFPDEKGGGTFKGGKYQSFHPRILGL